jgi:hypothetical protein
MITTHPQFIETVVEKSTYRVPQYKVTNEGLDDSEPVLVEFCKGNKDNPESLRQEGFFTESLLAVCVKYLTENNVGELANRDTSIAITEIENAILRLGKRAEDRKIRGVQGTYQK